MGTPRIRTCVVPGCTKTQETNPEETFHVFPRTEKVRRQWCFNIGKPDLFSVSYSKLHHKRVCGSHFRRSDYQIETSRKLNRGAVPSLLCSSSMVTGYDLIQEHNYVRLATAISNIVESRVPSNNVASSDSCPAPDSDLHSPPDLRTTEAVSTKTPSDCLRPGKRRNIFCTEREKQLYAQIKKLQRKLKYHKQKRKTVLGTLRKWDIFKNLKSLRQLDDIPKLAQIFLKSQVDNCRRESHAKRYTGEQKLLYAALLKYSPKGYKYLSNMLAMPSPRTLKRAML